MDKSDKLCHLLLSLSEDYSSAIETINTEYSHKCGRQGHLLTDCTQETHSNFRGRRSYRGAQKNSRGLGTSQLTTSQKVQQAQEAVDKDVVFIALNCANIINNQYTFILVRLLNEEVKIGTAKSGDILVTRNIGWNLSLLLTLGLSPGSSSMISQEQLGGMLKTNFHTILSVQEVEMYLVFSLSQSLPVDHLAICPRGLSILFFGFLPILLHLKSHIFPLFLHFSSGQELTAFQLFLKV